MKTFVLFILIIQGYSISSLNLKLEQEDPQDFKGIEQLLDILNVNKQASNSRERREVPDILKYLSKLTQHLSKMPGTSSVASLNLEGIIETSLTLLNEGFDNMQCCSGVGVSTLLMTKIEECGREPLIAFITELSIAAKQGQGNMLQPLVSTANLTQLAKSGMCTMKCAFKAMDLIGTDDLPATEKMIERLPQLVNPDAILVLKPALAACGVEMKKSLDSFKGTVNEENACWASNTLVDCMKNSIYKNCPDSRKQKGPDCLVKLGKDFWSTLPTSVLKLYEDMKQLFL